MEITVHQEPDALKWLWNASQAEAREPRLWTAKWEAELAYTFRHHPSTRLEWPSCGIDLR